MMRVLPVALLILFLGISSAYGQFLVVPDGAIEPDGRLSYAVPAGSQVGSGLPGGPQMAPAYGMGLSYPVYYPALWIPVVVSPVSPDHRPTRGGDSPR